MKDNLDDKLVYAIADENYYEEELSDYKNKLFKITINYDLEEVPDTMYPKGINDTAAADNKLHIQNKIIANGDIDQVGIKNLSNAFRSKDNISSVGDKLGARSLGAPVAPGKASVYSYPYGLYPMGIAENNISYEFNSQNTDYGLSGLDGPLSRWTVGSTHYKNDENNWSNSLPPGAYQMFTNEVSIDDHVVHAAYNIDCGRSYDLYVAPSGAGNNDKSGVVSDYSIIGKGGVKRVQANGFPRDGYGVNSESYNKLNLGIGDDLSNKDDWNGPWKVRDGTHPLGLNFNILDNCKLDGYQISTKCTEKRGFGFGRIGLENNLNLLLIEFIKNII